MLFPGSYSSDVIAESSYIERLVTAWWCSNLKRLSLVEDLKLGALEEIRGVSYGTLVSSPKGYPKSPSLDVRLSRSIEHVSYTCSHLRVIVLPSSPEVKHSCLFLNLEPSKQ